MVYKKYIKRDGKLYGPYTYESKRVDGKVVSEYHGPTKTFAFKKYAWIFASITIIFFLAYFLSTLNLGSLGSLTGKAVLTTEVNYPENEPISGNLSLSLKQGELFPSNSKLILENSGQTYEYNLSNFVSDSTLNGNFYIEGISLSGNGSGYGIEGEKTTYPSLSFILNIYPVENITPTAPEQTKPVSNESANLINETNVSNETPVFQTSNESSTTIENVSTNETTAAKPTSNETTEISTTSAETTTSPTSTETTSSSEPTSSTETTSPTSTETTSSSEPTSSTQTGETETGSATSPITGFFMRIYNFFLGLSPTGRAISEPGLNAIEVKGEVSMDKPFVYEISGGEGVQLKSGSVSISSSGTSISDDNIKITIRGNQIIVETSYSEIQKGFGNEFLGNEVKTINVDLSKLGLVLNDGNLTMKLAYGNDEILSTNTILKSGETAMVAENISNSTNLNITIEQPLNDTLNSTINVTFGKNTPQIITFDTSQFVLTEEDKTLLLKKYGDIVVQTTRSEIINGELIKRYEIGKDWIENSYNPALSEDALNEQMAIDRMKWLKDLAQRIKIKEKENQEQPQIVENFSVE